MDDEFYDICYDAWRSGKNPDNVSEDKWDYYRAEGYYPDEITLGMMLAESPEEKR